MIFLHSKDDDELVSLVDPSLGSDSGSDSDADADSDVSEEVVVTGHRSAPPFLDTPYPPDPPANATWDGREAASAVSTGGDADGRSHGSRP